MFLRFEQTGLSLETVGEIKRRNPVLVLPWVDLINHAQQVELVQGEAQFLGDLPPYRLFDRLQPIHRPLGSPQQPASGSRIRRISRIFPSWATAAPHPNRGSRAVMCLSD